MLPPVDISTLQDNQHFAALHNRLTSSKLNPDGSIKLSSEEAKSQSLLEEELIRAQTAAAKGPILKSILPRLFTSDLPDELLNLITLLQSTGPLPTELRSYLNVDPTLLSPIISPHLASLASSVLEIASTTPSIQMITPAIVTARRAALSSSYSHLETSRLALAASLSDILSTHRQTLEFTIRLLESHKHGAVARAVMAEVTYLVSVAEGMSAKLGVLRGEAYAGIYDEEVRNAVEAYREHLEGWKDVLGERGEIARGRLEGLEGNVGKEIRERYAVLRENCDKVKEEIAALEGEEGGSG